MFARDVAPVRISGTSDGADDKAALYGNDFYKDGNPNPLEKPAERLRRSQETEMAQNMAELNGANRRRLKRKYMLFKIPVYDGKTRRFIGLLQDITEKGLQLFGVEVEINSRKTLIVQASDYVRSAPLHFEAHCRWTRKESPLGYFVTGFEITAINEDSRSALLKLIESLTIG